MKRLLFGSCALALSVACAPRAAKIAPRAALDLQCPQDQIQVIEVDNQGDSGPHLVRGCGRRATYELDTFGNWVSGPVLNEPKHVQLDAQ